MSTATIDKLPGEPIVILTLSGSSSELKDREQERAKFVSIIETVSEPVFLILDMSDADLSFDEIAEGASGAYRGDNPLFKLLNIRQILQVSTDPALELAAKGMNTEIFGNVEVKQFETLDEALVHARTAG